MSNDYSNVALVLLLYSDTPGGVLVEEHPYIAQFLPGLMNLKLRLISEQ